MAPDPLSFAAGTLASADCNGGIRDPLRWLMAHSGGSKPLAVARLTTPVALTTSLFTSCTFDTTLVNRGGLLSGGTMVAPEDGVYVFHASVSVESTVGNKETRLAVDADETVWIAADNRYGIATPAAARMSCSGLYHLTAGQSVDVMVFSDAPSPGNVDGGVFAAMWVGL